MEKIMNDLDLGRATQSRELQDNELDAVSGGGHVALEYKQQKSDGGPPNVWVGCAWVPQWW
jgi:hypothetical protein